MIYPVVWSPGFPLAVTLSTDVFGTNVDATFCGVLLPRMQLQGVFVGDAPGQKGFDDVKLTIESLVRGAVESALRLSNG